MTCWPGYLATVSDWKLSVTSFVSFAIFALIVMGRRPCYEMACHAAVTATTGVVSIVPMPSDCPHAWARAQPMNILIVRLGALGDVVHAIPAAAALRAAMPGARIDWLVEAKHRPIVDLVTVVDEVVALEGPSIRAWTDVIRRMRQVRYDVAFDFQGLMKSAVLARASGAVRVAGFSIWHLREKGARPFYSETDDMLER